MAWAPIIGGGLQALGGVAGGLIGAGGAESVNAQQMAFNAQQAQQNRDWQEHMSNTAYQRAMADMRAAGLNPILAANLGGATTPGGGAGSIGGLANPGSLLGQGVSSAAGAVQTGTAIKTALAQADKDASATDVNKATEKLTEASTSKTKQDEATSKSSENLNNAAAATKVTEAAANMAGANSANATARVNTRIAEDTEKFGDSAISKAIGGLMRMLNNPQNVIPNSARDLNVRGSAVAPRSPVPEGTKVGPNIWQHINPWR